MGLADFEAPSQVCLQFRGEFKYLPSFLGVIVATASVASKFEFDRIQSILLLEHRLCQALSKKGFGDSPSPFGVSPGDVHLFPIHGTDWHH